MDSWCPPGLALSAWTALKGPTKFSHEGSTFSGTHFLMPLG